MMGTAPILTLTPLAAAEELMANAEAVESRFAWFHAAATATLGHGEKAFVASIGSGTALPLAIGEKRARALTTPYTSIFAPIAPQTELAFLLGQAIDGTIGQSLHLDALDPDDPVTAAFLRGLGQSRFVTVRYAGFAHWHERVPSFAAYWARRPARLQSTVKRKLKLAKGAAWHITASACRQALEIYEDIRTRSWKGAEPYPDFIPAMAAGLEPAGNLRIGILRLEGRPVAAQIWLCGNGRASLFKLVHDEAAAFCSPGTLLTWHMLRWLIDGERAAMIDFGRGDDAYKRDWAGSCVRRCGFIAADCRYPAGLATLMREILPTWAAQFVRRSFGKTGSRREAGRVWRRA